MTASKIASGSATAVIWLRRKVSRAEQHDHERNSHHDRARIDRDLRHGNERRAKQKIEHRHRHKVQHQKQRRRSLRLTNMPEGGQDGD